MRLLADGFIAYTEEEAASLRKRMPSKTVVAAPNALYPRSSIGAVSNGSPESFIFTGRLVSEKKPELLLAAFSTVVTQLPRSCRLTFVGEGPLRTTLERSAEELGVGSRVDVLGEITEWSELRVLYGSSLAAVSPGYVGLSIIQSLGFGVPMVIADEEPHAPEIEAAQPGNNSVLFEAGSSEALAGALVSVSQDADLWRSRRVAIAADCAERYSVDLMVSRMLRATLGPSAP